jgi:hypothetical protein
MSGLQGFIAGIATTSLAFYIYDYIVGYLDYVKFKKWLSDMDVNIRHIDEAEFDEYFAVWELSKLPGVEITGITNRNKEDGISKEN